MGSAHGKNIHPEDYEILSADGEDIELSVEAEDAPEADEALQVKPEEVLQPKKKKRRGRRGKKVVEMVEPKVEVVEEAEPAPEPVQEPEPEPEITPIVETIEIITIDVPKNKKKKAKKEMKSVEKATNKPIVMPIAKANDKPITKANDKPITKANDKPITKANDKPIVTPIAKATKTIKVTKAELHEEAKKEQIAMNRVSSIKKADRTCFACKNVCESRYQLNHHYGICPSFPAAYEALSSKDRSWYMIIQYVRNDLNKASRICLGCGSLFQTRHKLLEHHFVCENAMTIDTWDRITCFGLLYGTPYDDFEKFRPKYKEPKKVPDYVQRVHDFVESLKKTMLREKAEARLADEKMKVVEEERIQNYIKEKLQGGGVWAAKEASAKEEVKADIQAETKEEKQEPLPQRPKKERKQKEKPIPKVEPKAEEPKTIMPSEYIETCNCEHCDLVRTYPPLENPALRGAEREGYYVIPMVMDGYSTVVNARRIYVPTQNVLLRIHDLGSA